MRRETSLMHTAGNPLGKLSSGVGLSWAKDARERLNKGESYSSVFSTPLLGICTGMLMGAKNLDG